MSLYFRHRQFALILALVAASFTSPMLTGTGFAGTIGGSGSPSSDLPPGDGKGDPDVPTGPARKNIPGVQKAYVGPSRETLTVGDGRVPYGAWVWRIRIVLQGLRAYTFRF